MPWGGAYNRVPPDATAFVHREEHFQIKHAAVLDPGARTTAKAAAHRWVGRSWSTVHPWRSGRVFPELRRSRPRALGRGLLRHQLPRLVRIKAEYDPGNVFHADQSLPV